MRRPAVHADRRPGGPRRRALRLGGALLLLPAGAIVVLHLTRSSVAAGCTASDGSAVQALGLEQAGSATTVAAVGIRLGLPPHAVTVALATGLQESGLRNLTYGDRDSIGLFQQRPSQGWGTRQQILLPSYAAAAFYRRLTRVSGWQSLPVTAAAQAVQHSGAPDAYARWESEARLLARALTGEVAAGFTCRFTSVGTARPTALAAAQRSELGTGALNRSVATARGWSSASWLVARAGAYGISAVRFADRNWSAAAGTWTHAPATTRVLVTTS